MQGTFVFYKLFGLYYISIEILRPCHLFHNINGIHRRFYLFFKVPPSSSRLLQHLRVV